MTESKIKVLISVISACVVVSLSAPTSDQSCDQTVDMVFLVDTSSSIYKWDFDIHVKRFILDVVDAFSVGPGPRGTRVGLALFSNRVYHWFYLKAYMSKEDIQENVKKMKYKSGNTYTHKALEFTSYPMLSPNYGVRPGVPKVVITVTDGKSVYVNKTLEEARKLKDKGVYLYAVGVGAWNDYKELRAIASTPTDQFYFNITNDKVVNNIRRRFTDPSCFVSNTPNAKSSTPKQNPRATSSTTTTAQETTTSAQTSRRRMTVTTPSPTDSNLTLTKLSSSEPTGPSQSTSTSSGRASYNVSVPTTAVSAPGCQSKPADIYFLLDVSSSFDFWQSVLNFIRNLATSLPFSAMKTRVRLYSFSSTAEKELHPDLAADVETLKTTVEKVERVDGTNAGDAITYIIREAFVSGAAGKGVPQIILTVTDGNWERPKITTWTARDAKKRGIYMFAIGVGQRVDSRELQLISSKPSTQFIFEAESSESLGSIARVVNQKLCDVVGGLLVESARRPFVGIPPN